MITIERSKYDGRQVAGAIEVLIHEVGGYDWDSFHSWLDPETGKFYWYEDGGCSCNGPLDMVSEVGDLSVGSKDELIRAYKRFADQSYYFTEDEKASAEYEIRQDIKTALATAKEAA